MTDSAAKHSPANSLPVFPAGADRQGNGQAWRSWRSGCSGFFVGFVSFVVTRTKAVKGLGSQRSQEGQKEPAVFGDSTSQGKRRLSARSPNASAPLDVPVTLFVHPMRLPAAADERAPAER